MVNQGIISFTLESNRVKPSHTETHSLRVQVISAALGRLFIGLKLSLNRSLQLNTTSTQLCLLSPRKLVFTYILNSKTKI